MKFVPDFAVSRRFAPLFGTQFMGAFNDNLFKTAIFVLITFYGLGRNLYLPASQLLNLGAMVFILPYFLFSALAGQINTRFDKAVIARAVKIAEIGIMTLAAVGFFSHSALILLACLFLMGTHSTVFGPLKYAILPDYLSEKELITGNSLIEMGTFLAILIGQMLGTLMVRGGPWLMSLLVLTIAVLGLLFSLKMPKVAPKNPDEVIDWNISRSTRAILQEAWEDPQIRTAILGISWFWLLGAVYTTQLPTFTEKHLGGNENVFNLMLTLFSIGIGLGSLSCARLSHVRLELGLVLFGAAGMTLFGTVLAVLTFGHHQGPLLGLVTFLAQPRAHAVCLCIFALGFFGGFFSVPLYTWLQTASSEAFRAQAVAANNIVNGLFMVAAAVASAVLIWLSDSISLLYLVVALGNVGIAYLLVRLWPPIWEGKFRWLRRPGRDEV